MARCGCGACTCNVEAGTGTTVTGSGNPSDPFIISADGVSCDDVRPCISATGGAAYDSATGVITADLSGDAGNTLVLGGDGGLYVPPVTCAQVRPCISATDGVAYDSATGVITADISTDAGNSLALGTDNALFVPTTVFSCDDVRPCISGTAGVNYDSATGVISADISGTAGNQLALDAQGLYVPAVTCAQVRPCLSGTNGVTYDAATGVISADISGTAGNQLALDAQGLYVPAVTCAQVRPCISATDGVTYDSATGVITADISTDAGNTLVLGTDDGLFVPAGAVTCAQVRPCLSGTAGVTYDSATGVISADISGTAGNQLTLDAQGLYVPAVTCAQVRPCLSGTNGVTYDSATGVISADISGTAGNQLTLDAQGLYVPEASVTADCGLTGTGTLADPLAAAVGTWGFPCDLDTEAGQVYCDSTGVLRSEPRPKTDFFESSVNTSYPATAVPAAINTLIEPRSLMITNPDACRTAYVIVEVELDVDFTLPAGAGASSQIGNDSVNYLANEGSATVTSTHTTTTFVYHRTIPPGGVLNETINVRMGRGSGGATYTRIQTFMRAFVFAL